MGLVIGKRILIRGFIVSDQDFGPKYIEEHWKNVGNGLKMARSSLRWMLRTGLRKQRMGLWGC